LRCGLLLLLRSGLWLLPACLLQLLWLLLLWLLMLLLWLLLLLLWLLLRLLLLLLLLLLSALIVGRHATQLSAERQSGLLSGQADHGGQPGRGAVRDLDPAVPALNVGSVADETHEAAAQRSVVRVVHCGS